MRKRRVIIFDDEPVVLLVLKNFFEDRGYEVLSYAEPTVCPVYRSGTDCANEAPCGDVLLTDYKMPGMNGVELIEAQVRKGCRLTPKNKALLTGFLDDGKSERLRRLGAAFFEKPVLFDELGRWLAECEGRMDLSCELGLREDRRS